MNQENIDELKSIMKILQKTNTAIEEVEYDLTQAFVRMHTLIEEMNKP